jgi:hypothetical protein
LFSYEILEDDGVIVLATTGQMAVEDYQVVAPKFYADVRAQGIRRILLDWREFQGWKSEEAPTITFFSWLESRPLFDRIAVVFHEGVRNEAEKFEEFFRNAGKDVRLFQPEQYAAALDWLKRDKAANSQE